MEVNLLEKTVNEIMEKFGAGNHKPGSGSAAAFQGMISAKLISTVISLCADEKRVKRFSHCIDELLDYQNQIEKRIYPRLADLFQYDSDQFDKTIKLRSERDEEKDEVKKNQLRREALEELKISIATPFQIANLCKEVTQIGEFVFDNGFKSARGDSQVGISGAVSAIAGCIAIIRLNVLSFNSDEIEYLNKVVSRVEELSEVYEKLNKVAYSKIVILKEEYERKIPLFEGVNGIIQKYRETKKPELENCARDLQNLVWKNRELIWTVNVPKSELDILKPEIILKKVLGYDYFSSAKYAVPNEEGDAIEVAGVIDQPNKLVMISNNYSKEVRNFTTAHELAHAILHNQPILHRDDLAIEYSGQRKLKNTEEIQADKFASYFLMPKALVIKEFEKNFSINKFVLNEETAFMFGGKSLGDIRSECKSLRELSRKLARSISFNGNRFESLAKKFKVSTEAMAIRLEELDVVFY
ncbi:methenyltetrahydrofolate cyclohydrolase [Flavobacteriaceae bacterium LYZ1037]|nr:methenyltetrahydrofolate cyclohydrolase [Flavobacteriaceae bacterium LYZ1037]